jgi:hypothetical protein
MTLHEAYLKAKVKAEKMGLPHLVGCTDFGDFWGFRFSSLIYDENDEHTWVGGGGYETVNKQTGEIGNFVPLMDFDLFEKGKPIPIEQFAAVPKVAVA